MKCRGLRLESLAGVALMTLFALAPCARQAAAQAIPTQTTLSVADGPSSPSRAFTVSVIGADGTPAAGIVNFLDGARQLDEAVLNAQGQASATVNLPPGEHDLKAVFLGSKNYQASASDASQVHTEGSGGSTPNFQVSLTPVSPSTVPLTLTAGQSGSFTVTVTPIDNSALTAPMYITLSCSGLPTLASCSFAPENLEILPSTLASCASGSTAPNCPPTSLMVLETEGPGTSGTPLPPADRPAGSAGLALLLPGMLGLGGIAWGARRRRWLQRLALVALLGLVTTLGATACNPFYYYLNHGPPVTPATPAGTYTVTVTAQSSNGVTAITNDATLALTVQ